MGGTFDRDAPGASAARFVMAPPRKRVVISGDALGDGPSQAYQNVPLDVITPFRAYWDAFGTILPDNVNRQRRTRRAMLRLIR